MLMFRSVMILALAISLSLLLSAQNGQASTSAKCTATGDLEIREFKSGVFHNTRKLRVLLPAGYRDPKNARTQYSILYLNDCQNIFDVCTSMWEPKEWQVDETTIRLIAEGKVEPLIIVGIDNAGRHEKARLAVEAAEGSRPNEYLPFPDDTLDPPLAQVHGTSYPQFLTQEVMPFIEKNYRVQRGPEHTGLGGSSYGGLITFYVALHTNRVFGRVLIESPSLYVRDFAILKEAENHRDWPARIYFGAGTEEDTPDPTETMAQDVDKAVRLVRSEGVSNDRMLVKITRGRHDEDAWAARFPEALEFLFPAPGKR